MRPPDRPSEAEDLRMDFAVINNTISEIQRFTTYVLRMQTVKSAFPEDVVDFVRDSSPSWECCKCLACKDRWLEATSQGYFYWKSKRSDDFLRQQIFSCFLPNVKIAIWSRLYHVLLWDLVVSVHIFWLQIPLEIRQVEFGRVHQSFFKLQN